MSDTPKVMCGRCRRVLEEPSDLAVDQRQPCPVCGSTSRHVSITLAATMVGVASLAVVGVPKVVQHVPADERPEATEIRGVYRASLEWHALEGNLWLVQVRNVDGELVDGGIGNDPEEALLEVYERLIPP